MLKIIRFRNRLFFLDNKCFLSYIKLMEASQILKKYNIHVFLYLIGFFITSLEAILYLSEKSICPTEGCRIVESFVRGGEIILIIIGVVLFGILFLLSIIKKSETIHSVILISALSVEGYLLGFQIFFIKEFCLFCIMIFGIFFIAVILRLIQGRREVTTALLCFFSVFFITYFVNPQINEFPDSQYVLVYSKDCARCKEILDYCKQLSIPVNTLETKEVIGILKSLQISSVPVLLSNEKTEKKFIVGAENIKEYLYSKALPKQESTGVCPIFTHSDCK